MTNYISEDMKQRIIDAAHRAVEREHEDDDCIDRTEVESQVLLGLLKIIDEQKDRIGVLERTIERMPKPVTLIDVFGNYANVVRCKDCKHGEKAPTFEKYPDVTWCNKHLTSHNDDWFCADGEKAVE